MELEEFWMFLFLVISAISMITGNIAMATYSMGLALFAEILIVRS